VSGPFLPRRRDLLAAAALGVLGLAGCSPPEPGRLVMAGGERGGFFNEFAHLLAAAVAGSGEDFRLEPLTTTGTLHNLDLLRSGEASIGLALTDAAVKDAEGLAAIGRVYQTYWQLAVPVDSPIRSVADLRGRTVSLGPARSGTRFTALRILAAGGVGADDLTVRQIAVADVGRALVEGQVDAALFAGGVPLPAVEAPAGKHIRLIDLATEVKALRQRYGSVYRAARIPRGVYGTETETRTLGVASLLLARTDVSDSVAGQLVDVLVSRPADLVPAETLGTQYLDPRTLITTAGVPLHPGAAAAYRRLHG
jgi:uncharacterized protein